MHHVIDIHDVGDDGWGVHLEASDAQGEGGRSRWLVHVDAGGEVVDLDLLPDGAGS